MARYFFYADIGKWVKQCSCCFIVTEGTANEAESVIIFKGVFSEAKGLGAADGLQSRCWLCNCSRRSTIGASRQIVEALYKEQYGKCAICTTEISILRGANEPANVDHDAKTGIIRALLCGNCNRGIGLFFHDPKRLKAASQYCEKHDNIIQLRCVSDAG